MKPKGLAKTLLGTSALTAVVISFGIPSAFAASDTWDNGGGDNLWQTVTNWASDATFPGTAGNVFTSTDVATFSTTGASGTIDLGGTINILNLTFGVAGGDAASFAIADANDTLNFTTAGGITINSGVTTAQTIGVSGTTINLSDAAAASTTFTNNGTGLLTIAGNIAAQNASGAGVLTVDGTGNTTITGTITEPGVGNNALKKIGSGTLTLTNGSAWSGTGAVQTAFSGPFTVQEGTLLLNGGTHAVTGEAVIGGVVTHGGAGQNAKVQIDAGALTVSNWLSIGRGNGVGGVSSDLVLNNAATVTTVNLSAGYNANNALNLPKGSITLNNTSVLNVTSTATGTGAGAATFVIGESAGSDMTLTVNDSAVVNRTAGNTQLDGTSQNQGAIQIGRAGKGTVIMNGGTINAISTDLGRGVNNTTAQNGTLTINTGATYNNEGDFRMGFAGGASGQATLNLQGGTLNIGTTTARTMVIGTFDAAQSTVNIQSGNLNLNTNSSIRFNTGNNSATKVFNLNGGAVTSYSDNQTTANGSGVLDMMFAGVAGSNNTFNLNGGTLTIGQIISTTNNGTRTFNFNGGTLKATGDTAAFMNLGTGTARANVRNGGAVIDTNGFIVTVGQALEHSNIGGDNAIDGGLTKTGTGSLTLTNAANTYTGATLVLSGELATGATGNFGLGNVTVADSITASLNLGNGSSIADTATLFFGDAAESIKLNNATSETVFGITQTDDSQSIGAGIYTADDLNTFFGVTNFVGEGTLTVVPEPSAALLGGLGVLGLLRRRRKA